jgi:hypothetical protein
MKPEYKPAEGEMTRSQLFELSVRIKHMRRAMNDLLEFTIRENIGMSKGFCEKYPFHESFDELVYDVAVWEMEVEGKHLDEIQAQQDYYNDVTEVSK